LVDLSAALVVVATCIEHVPAIGKRGRFTAAGDRDGRRSRCRWACTCGAGLARVEVRATAAGPARAAVLGLREDHRPARRDAEAAPEAERVAVRVDRHIAHRDRGARWIVEPD